MQVGRYIYESRKEWESKVEPKDNYPHRGKKISNKTHRSTTDPDARLSRKSSTAATELSHSATYIMDNKSRVIVGANVGKPDLKTDRDKAMEQIRRLKWRHRIRPESLGADKGYAAGEFLQALINEDIYPHIPIIETKRHNHIGIYPRELFQYDETKNIYICPEGKRLKYWGIHKQSRQHVYRARKGDCSTCNRKEECTKDTARSVSFHIHKDSIQKAKALNKTKEYRISNGEAKEFMGLRRYRSRCPTATASFEQTKRTHGGPLFLHSKPISGIIYRYEI